MIALIMDNDLSFCDVLYVGLATMLKELAYRHLRIKVNISRIIDHTIFASQGYFIERSGDCKGGTS